MRSSMILEILKYKFKKDKSHYSNTNIKCIHIEDFVQLTDKWGIISMLKLSKVYLRVWICMKVKVPQSCPTL